MAKTKRAVIGGVDTHGLTHHSAVVDEQGRLLGDAQFAADTTGYRQPAAWLRRHGEVAKVGVEGTGSYGAGLAAYLHLAVVVGMRYCQRTRTRAFTFVAGIGPGSTFVRARS